jgi:hypothetical protein
MLIRGIGDRVSWLRISSRRDYGEVGGRSLFGRKTRIIRRIDEGDGFGFKGNYASNSRDLVQRTRGTFKALEISELQHETFVFQVKPSYTPLVRRFAQQPIIPNSALKTLSYIAYEQPITSKRLVQIRGSQVYSHLKELRAHSFIEYENLGRTKFIGLPENFKNILELTT